LLLQSFFSRLSANPSILMRRIKSKWLSSNLSIVTSVIYPTRLTYSWQQ
jgi:hypothetical protein